MADSTTEPLGAAPPLEERRRIAEAIRAARGQVADAVTREFFDRHPDWRERYGARGVKLGVEDAEFHLDFLAAAIESGSLAPFEDYAQWTARMLAARGIEPRFVAENLEQIGGALRARLPAARASVVARWIEAGISAARRPAEPPPAVAGDLALTHQLFQAAVLHGRRRDAALIAIDALEAGHALADVFVDVIQETMYEVGRMWESNRLTVAEEHMATAIVQYVIGQLYHHLEVEPARRGVAVVTGVQGDLHQVGAHMLSDALEAEGWRVRFLGTNLPNSGIVRTVEELEAGVLAISATMLFSLPKVASLIRDVRARLGDASPWIVVGGRAFAAAPDAWRDLGADGYAADLRGALEAVRARGEG